MGPPLVLVILTDVAIALGAFGLGVGLEGSKKVPAIGGIVAFCLGIVGFAVQVTLFK